MTECRYCGELWERTKTGFKVCNCEEAQQDFNICFKIQSLEQQVSELKRDLSKIRSKND